MSIAACILIKDENEYLQEWLDWHFALGIEHVYIYDNGEKECVPPHDNTTIIDWHGQFDCIQREAYAHFLEHHGHKHQWAAFLDSDEFLRVVEDTSLDCLLKEYESYGALHVGWLFYDANGQEFKSALPVRERFTRTTQNHMYRGFGKLIVQPVCAKSVSAHHAVLREGKSVCNESFLCIPPGTRWRRYSGKRIVVDHYYTKSHEEWCQKISRGSCDPANLKRYSEFFEINPDLSRLRVGGLPRQQKYG